ncbi:Biopolymer transport protein ExbB [Caulifigura coniformis]|uniref:Biopolymer transport protein ExbB n=1 Tax=Caulifigura coniformis TaxID=2527983 RepID=A0A517SHJ3_9PLAN|nr:MotA/TolQ/ExbB proton channel family protein [Caulifigura coniformis]QDT55600.1 Biopolymer transport protein ExbB [Caulifigura coniformis]
MQRLRTWRTLLVIAAALILLLAGPIDAFAAEDAPARHGAIFQEGRLNVRELLRAGGLIGYVTIFLSLGMVALIVEQVLTVRRGTLMPRGLPEDAHKLISAGKYPEAEALTRDHPSFLGFLIATGLQDVDLGYASVEKAMEDAAVEQSARLLRKVEYFTVIAAVGPLLGLMGTVWGMIQAFAEFAERANPSPADFAPSISEALVTTFFGISVAVPAVCCFAFFRNRVDELTAEATITAGHVMAPLKRALVTRARPVAPAAVRPDAPRPAVPPVVAEREPRR